MITEQEIERCLNILARTDVEMGRLTGLVKGLEYRMKVTKAVNYLMSSGTVQERESNAVTSVQYRHEVDQYQDAVAELETLKAKRKTAELKIDCWRTQESSKRKGNI